MNVMVGCPKVFGQLFFFCWVKAFSGGMKAGKVHHKGDDGLFHGDAVAKSPS
ncbi:MAG: hypothetical protein ACQEV7_18760 [Bacillota bacterium]